MKTSLFSISSKSNFGSYVHTKTTYTQELPVPPFVGLIPPQPYIPPPIPPTRQPHIFSMSTHPHVPPLMAHTLCPHILPLVTPTPHPHVPPLVDTTQQSPRRRELSKAWIVHIIGNFKFYSTYK